MRLFLASAAWLFAVLAIAADSSDCTTFISTQAGCCPPASSSTVYSAVDCHGCSLATTTTGIHCMMVCLPLSSLLPAISSPNTNPRFVPPTHQPPPEQQLSRLARSPRLAPTPSLGLSPSAAPSLCHPKRKSATLTATAVRWRLRRSAGNLVLGRFVGRGGRRLLARRVLLPLRGVGSEWGLMVMLQGFDDV